MILPQSLRRTLFLEAQVDQVDPSDQAAPLDHLLLVDLETLQDPDPPEDKDSE